ncbi:MAG: hypothetical protein K2X81_01260 [Candidatus Obscuribacterales bacterium]|nr:hypothetical protein [Candidatus Obscuribacterales bacterium]
MSDLKQSIERITDLVVEVEESIKSEQYSKIWVQGARLDQIEKLLKNCRDDQRSLSYLLRDKRLRENEFVLIGTYHVESLKIISQLEILQQSQQEIVDAVYRQWVEFDYKMNLKSIEAIKTELADELALFAIITEQTFANQAKIRMEVLEEMLRSMKVSQTGA